MRHYLTLAVAVIIGVATSGDRTACGSQGCSQGCAPVRDFTPSSIRYRIVFTGTISDPEKDYIAGRIAEGATIWNSEFSSRDQNISTQRNEPSYTHTIEVTDQIVEGQAFVQGNNMTIPMEWATNQGAFPSDYVNIVVGHEIGHWLGFAQSNCANASLMSDTTVGSYRGIQPCDTQSMTQYYGQVQYDNDGDGYYAPRPSNEDCDDTDPDIYPGAYDTNPWCGCGCQWPPYTDYNCDGLDDYTDMNNVCSNSPILVDVSGNGFLLTDRAHGVRFDLDRDGQPEQLPWTDQSGDEAWLALDRNGNGVIDDGGELFGNYSPQPPSQDPNGFLALAEFDRRDSGGNEDGWIDESDSVFAELRLWRDINHDGVSQPNEMRGLDVAGVRRMALEHREFLRVDQFGNWFRFGARIIDERHRDIGPWAFDVFLDYPANQLPPGPGRRLGKKGGR